MKVLISVFACCLILTDFKTTLGATVVSDSNVSMRSNGTNYVVKIYQNAAASDYTEAWFSYSNFQLKCTGVAVDESSDWYLVQPGNAFGSEMIDSGSFLRLAVGGNLPPIDVGPGDFYLGVSTGLGFSGNPPTSPNRSVFGWIHFRPVSGSLAIVGNAMSYASPGIIVGTTNIVPEPASWIVCTIALLIFGFAICFPSKGCLVV